MNTDTGNIVSLEFVKALRADQQKKYKEMQVPPTPVQMLRRPPRVGRNEACPCGSGRKFKKCCYTGGQLRAGRDGCRD